MTSDDTNADDLPAGDFAPWVTQMQRALRGDHGSDVPCGTCTACCTSSQFVHIDPDETDTLAYIPAELLFPAPQMPRGHVLLGYDERGHCPMLVDDACSIYEHRPRACRTYDCRVFAAAGIDLDNAGKDAIFERVRRWQFAFPTRDDKARSEAVRAAARYLDEHANRLGKPVHSDATQRAVLAVEIHELFLGREPEPAVVRDEVGRRLGGRNAR